MVYNPYTATGKQYLDSRDSNNAGESLGFGTLLDFDSHSRQGTLLDMGFTGLGLLGFVV